MLDGTILIQLSSSLRQHNAIFSGRPQHYITDYHSSGPHEATSLLILWLQTVSDIKPGVPACVFVCEGGRENSVAAAHPCLHSAGAAGGGLIQEPRPPLVNNLERHTQQKSLCPSFCLFPSLWKTPDTKLCLFKWQPVCWTKLLIRLHTCTAKANRKHNDYLTRSGNLEERETSLVCTRLHLDRRKTWFKWFLVLMLKGCIRSEQFRSHITHPKHHFTVCSH